MNRLEARIAELEKSIKPEELPWVRLIAKEGESSRDCVVRHGYDPDGQSHNFIIIQPVSPGHGATPGGDAVGGLG